MLNFFSLIFSWTWMYMDINLCFQTMAYNWPTWVNNSEFLMMDAVKKVFTKSSFFTAFNMGWKALGRKLSIPVCHRAALEDPHTSRGWPVVVFSHGMGCNRFLTLFFYSRPDS